MLTDKQFVMMRDFNYSLAADLAPIEDERSDKTDYYGFVAQPEDETGHQLAKALESMQSK